MKDEKSCSVDDFGGWKYAIHLCAPAGIGDISWVYSKVCHLKRILNREVILSVPGLDEPKRGGDFIQLLPEVHWGGYLDDRDSWQVITNNLSDNWREHLGANIFLGGPGSKFPFVQNISANFWLECGNSLKDWMPQIPTEYHYDLRIPEEEIEKASDILEELTSPIICVYVSNRDKENQRDGGWNLWSADTWCRFLFQVNKLTDCSFVFVGADYDSDKTNEIADRVNVFAQAKKCVGEKLGTALTCLKNADYFFGFPSGIGVLANVLRTPGIMFLPWILEDLTGYADPNDIANKRYRIWPDPDWEEVLVWFRKIGMIRSGLELFSIGEKKDAST